MAINNGRKETHAQLEVAMQVITPERDESHVVPVRRTWKEFRLGIKPFESGCRCPECAAVAALRGQSEKLVVGRMSRFWAPASFSYPPKEKILSIIRAEGA